MDQAQLKYNTSVTVNLNVLAVHGASEPDRVSKFGVVHEMLDGSISEQIAGGRRAISIDFAVMTTLDRRKVVKWFLDPDRQIVCLMTAPTVTGTISAGGTLTGGVTHHYKVCAIDVIGHGAASAAFEIEVGPGGSESLLTVNLAWAAIANARSYAIYRSVDNEATYDLIDYSETNSYTDAGTAIYVDGATVPSAATHIHVITTNELDFSWGNDTEVVRLLNVDLREASIFTMTDGFPE
jgi:hypothetical protein